MAIPVGVTSPANGATIDADDEVVFVVDHDGLPDVLTADLTLADGSVERAWDNDQAVNGYEGSLEVDGDERTYRLRRPIGWPFGQLSAAVHVEDDEGGGVGGSWGPEDHSGETFETTVGVATVVKEWLVAFSGLSASADALKIIFDAAAQVKYENGQSGDVQIWIGGTSMTVDGTMLWSPFGVYDAGGLWTDLSAVLAAAPIPAFTNPSPSGTAYVKLVAGAGVLAGFDTAGWRTFTIQILEKVFGEETDAGSYTTTSIPYVHLKSLDVDCTGFPSGEVLRLMFDNRSEQKLAENGEIKAYLGGTAGVEDGVLVYTTGVDGFSSWHSVKDFIEGDPEVRTPLFSSPGSGTQKLKFFATGGGSEVGVRTLKFWIASIGGGVGPDEGDATASWTVDDPDAVAASRTIIQYREAPKLNALIRFHQRMCQQIIDAARAIELLDDPAEAGGVNLDVTADLVGQSRITPSGDVATDAELRVLIAARISRNNARVSTADYLRALIQLFDATVRISVDAGMAIAYVVMRQPTAEEIAVLDADIVARPMGVRVTRSWAPTDYFGFAADPEASGFEVGHFPEGF